MWLPFGPYGNRNQYKTERIQRLRHRLRRLPIAVSAPLFRVNFTACSQADPVSGYYANRTKGPGSPRGTSITRNLLERSASLSEALAPATAALSARALEL